jgi:hypothetical protein
MSGLVRTRSARERGDTVDAYIARQAPHIARIIDALREIVLEAAPAAVESIKWGQPIYDQDGPFAFMRAAKQHVTFGFWRGSNIPDPDARLEGSGSVMRHLKVRSESDIPAEALTAMIQMAIALNREHGDPTRTRSGTLRLTSSGRRQSGGDR